MRCLIVLTGLALLLAPLPTAQEEFAFGVPRGARIEKSFTTLIELSLVEQTQTLNGEEIEGADDSDMDVRSTMKGKRVFVDEYREVSGARPRVLAREFVTLEGRHHLQVRAPGFDEEETQDAESPLEGETVVFTWNDSDEQYGCKYDGDGRGDRDLLAELVADSDLCDFLPDGPVSKGDSWELDAQHFMRISEPSGNVRLALEDEDEEDQQRERELNENMAGDLVATFEGFREEDGVRVAVIVLRAELTSHSETSGEDEDGDSTETQFGLALDLEGELLWDPSAGRPHSHHLAGDVEMNVTETTTWEDEDDGESYALVGRMKMTGTFTLTGTWLPAD